MGCNLSCLKLKWLFCKRDHSNAVHNTLFPAFKTEESLDDFIRNSIDPKVLKYSTMHKKKKSKVQLEAFKIEKVAKNLYKPSFPCRKSAKGLSEVFF